MKINEIIVRLEKWAETLGYSTKQGDLSEIIKDLREEAKVFSPNAMLKVTSDSTENKKESEVAVCDHELEVVSLDENSNLYRCKKCLKKRNEW